MAFSAKGHRFRGFSIIFILLAVGFLTYTFPILADPESDDPDRSAENRQREEEEERAYNRWLEERARHMAEHHNCHHRRYEDCDCVCDCDDDYYRYYKPDKKHSSGSSGTDFHIGLLFSPENRNGVNGFGIEFLDLDDNPFGGTLWMAGDPEFFFTGDEIEATIPHDDYTTTSNTGEFGFIFEVPLEMDTDAWFLLGAGATFQSTHYTDTSDVTGWDWDGGSHLDDFIPSAQASLLFRLGDSGALRLGYDSHYEWFFGIVF